MAIRFPLLLLAMACLTAVSLARDACPTGHEPGCHKKVDGWKKIPRVEEDKHVQSLGKFAVDSYNKKNDPCPEGGKQDEHYHHGNRKPKLVFKKVYEGYKRDKGDHTTQYKLELLASEKEEKHGGRRGDGDKPKDNKYEAGVTEKIKNGKQDRKFEYMKPK